MARLARLLRPRSIAVVGGGFWGRNVIAECRKIGFAGDLWAVHPTRDEVEGVKAVPRIADLPSSPDVAYLGVNRAATVEAVAALSAMGAGGAVCLASGFREAVGEMADGAEMQAALLAAAGDMPVLGPNCYGLINALDRVALWPDQHGAVPVEAGVAIVMQSSNIAINLTMQTRALPIAYMVTVGNQASVGLSDVGMALIEDPRVSVLGLHIEGIDDLRAFERLAARARALGKSIVALKAGRSEAARAATVTHTASLSGSAEGAAALFRRLGVGQATSLAGFLEALKLLHVAGPLPSYRLAAASCSGGEAGLMADSVVGTPLEFHALKKGQIAALRGALGPKVTLSNPLDYHTYIWGDVDAMTATFSALTAGDAAIGIVILDLPRADRCDPGAWMPVIEAVARVDGRIGVLATLPETMPEDVAEGLVAHGVVPLSGVTEAVEALRIAADIGSVGLVAEPLLLPEGKAGDRVLTEAEAKTVLSAYGVRVPKARKATTAARAVEAAEEIRFPVVLKGEGIAHKTEAGAVVLNLATGDAVGAAAGAMPCETFLVEEMVSDCVAELLVGVVVDPAHGYVLTLAAGGQLTEVIADAVTQLLPVTEHDVREALDRLRIARVLNGYRNRPGADIDAIVQTVMAVARYVAAHRPAELEINPLICGTSCAIAADALIRPRED
ncbi:MAG: acetate--CoA ligase family protein [Pseudomonadota bacterium]